MKYARDIFNIISINDQRSTINDQRSTIYIEIIFILITAPLIIFFCIAVPVGQAPDEQTQILRADSVRHGEMWGRRSPRLDDLGKPSTDVIVLADISLLEASLAFDPETPLASKRETSVHLEKMRQIKWRDKLDLASVPNTGVYPPLFYIPGAAAIKIAKHVGLGPYDACIAVRLTNGFFYIVLGVLSLIFANRGRMIFFSILCLPMSIYLAASINQDGLIIGCTCLTGSLLSRADTHERKTYWIFGVICLAAAVMAKPFLLPLGIMVPATVPGGFRANIRSAISGFVAAVCPAIIWSGAMAAFVASPFNKLPALPPGPLWSGLAGARFATTAPLEQLHILFSKPSLFATIPLNTMINEKIRLWREVIGVLGALDVSLPDEAYDIWAYALTLALIASFVNMNSTRICVKQTIVHFLAAIGGIVGAVWLVCVIQYVTWTRVGEIFADGIQGRYLLPIAALSLPWILPPFVRGRAAKIFGYIFSAPAIIAGVAGFAFLPGVVLAAYYLR